MARALIAAVLILGTIAGCARISGSRLNPFNWFGRSVETVTADLGPLARDPRPLMDQVTQLVIEPTPGGAIIRATGLPPTQGHWDGELVSVSDNRPIDGVLEFQFRVIPPATPTRVSTPQSREVIVGRFFSRQKLENVREIRVVAARNTRATRR